MKIISNTFRIINFIIFIISILMISGNIGSSVEAIFTGSILFIITGLSVLEFK